MCGRVISHCKVNDENNGCVSIIVSMRHKHLDLHTNLALHMVVRIINFETNFEIKPRSTICQAYIKMLLFPPTTAYQVFNKSTIK